MISSLFLSCAITGLLWFLLTPLRTRLWLIPGPWWRRYSDIFQVLDAYNGQTYQAIQGLHKKYGPVVQVGPRTVIFSEPAMIGKVYANRSPFPKSHHWRALGSEQESGEYPSLVSTEDTQTHSAIKRPITGIYSMSSVTRLENFINECIRQLVETFVQEFNGGEKSLCVHSWMRLFAYDTMMKLAVSADFGLIRGEADREEMFKNADAAHRYQAMASNMPWVHSLLKGTPITKAFEKHINSFPHRARELIENRRANGAGNTPNHQDLLSQMMETQKKHPEIVNDQLLYKYVSIPLVAGSDGLACSLTSIVYFVGKHHRVAAKLYEELQSSGLQMPPPWAAVQKLPYLEAVIRESFRCHPPAAVLSRRVIPPGSGLTVEGVTLPPGTAVAMSGWSTHFNKSSYGDDAHLFWPERWLKDPRESEDDYAERLRRMNKADLTWGAGNRACIGKNIAKCEIYKLIATLYSMFDIQLVDPTKEWRINDHLLARQEGVKANFILRSGASLSQLVQVTS